MMQKPGGEPIEICENKLLLVEGQDEVNFFEKLCAHWNINGYQIVPVGGKDQFPKKFPPLIKSPGFSDPGGARVTHLAVIRDQDGDNAFESIANIIRKCDLLPPENEGFYSTGRPKVGVFIMPGNTIKGTMLEDLCLKTQENHPAMLCVNEFAACISQLDESPNDNVLSKTKAYAFLAAQPKPVNSIGLGAQRRYWDFDSPHLDELKVFSEHFR